ncbi:NADH-cytochrome b5 reductase 2 [Heterocephalus glaber]|uniref:NADH-cytochrome b5 reductase 2 n=1 Tax=Heterocephalus glaber TaxID=10181 RepID=G5B7C7_HETGA|nr:NADH-cytochrome b5 reductase 2 [Heterocephalus glaber]
MSSWQKRGRWPSLCLRLPWRPPDLSLLLAITFLGVTVLLFALRSMNSRRKDLITLQDPDTKYPLPLIEKEVVGQPNSSRAVCSCGRKSGLVKTTLPCFLIYFKNVHPKYPEGGKMTQYLENMKIGDTILFRGPTGQLFYQGPGRLAIKPYKTSQPENKLVRHLGMITGGTGITPMLQLIRHITKNPSDRTRTSLLFANQTEEDILMRKELEEIARTHLDQFSIWYTLDRPPLGVRSEQQYRLLDLFRAASPLCSLPRGQGLNPEPHSDFLLYFISGWNYGSGFVTAHMIKEHLPPPGEAILILVCGPPPLIQTAAHPSLEQLAYTKDMIFTY